MWIPFAVKPFVMMKYDIEHKVPKRVFVQKIRADQWVGFDGIEFRFGEFIWFTQNNIGDADLSEVMQVTAYAGMYGFILGEAKFKRKQFCQLRDAPDVPTRIGIARFDHIRHHQQGFEQVFFNVHAASFVSLIIIMSDE